MTRPSCQVTKRKSNFVFKRRRVYFLKNPTLKDEKIEEYTQENIPKERDFQKKYLLLDRFISHLNDELAKLDEVLFRIIFSQK